MSDTETQLVLKYTNHPSKSLNVVFNISDLALKLLPNPDTSLLENNSETILITEDIINALNKYDIQIIDSQKSGGKATVSSFYNDILNPIFTTFGINHKYLKTISAHSIQEYANSVNLHPGSKSLYLFLSGDTSIFEFVNFLLKRTPSTNFFDSNISILPFPHGTGNALCHSLMLSNDLLCLKAFFKGHSHHLPLYRINSNSSLICKDESLSNLLNPNIPNQLYFLVVASWCLHSSLVYLSDTPEMRSNYGSERFRIAAKKILEENPTFKAKISFQPDNKYLSYQNNKWSISPSQISNDLSYFLLSAVSNFEKNFKISPNSVVGNDQLHLLSIPHIKPDEIMNIMNLAYNKGSHLNDQYIYYSPLKNGNSLELEISNEMDSLMSIICLDGSSWEVKGIDRKLTFSYFDQSFLHYIA
ncbi:hypothetical protein C6P40_004604 [Pichia californica]|uniref:DAGKc domain-containing protein n=1 Tax=Pichia californica TaxID=460514 RepID=A0A9P7BGV9_9ASCO|nr:hypothetical protein C6P42_000233 [[Candida] californica]KAG0689705.1 hypothetical protein C6P40_004604 [[Candida] californica]